MHNALTNIRRVGYMRYCVLYPNTKNVNLVKEMGMIPYKLYKNFGYD